MRQGLVAGGGGDCGKRFDERSKIDNNNHVVIDFAFATNL